MDNLTDQQLIARFLEGEKEDSFRMLVERHSSMVYGCARRIVGDHQTAQDVAQAVFLFLSRKAPTLKNYSSIAGWLYRCTSFMARDAVKLSRRREAREREGTFLEAEENSWTELAVHLDSCMDFLSDSDRQAILLRFFENQSLREVGRCLGLSEDTTQKRITRALDRLRKNLIRRGIVLPAVTLASLLSANAATAAPAGTCAALLATVASSSPPSVFVSSILKAGIQTMVMSKLKIAAITTLVLLLLTGGAGFYVVHHSTAHAPKLSVPPPTPLQLLAGLAEAARLHDGSTIAAAVHVTNEDRRQRLQSLTHWINAVGSFDRECRKAFGDEPTDEALWNTAPPVLYRLDFGQKNLSSANMRIMGDVAQVNIQRDRGVWQFILFQKVNGIWKVSDEAVDDVANPRDAETFAKLTPMLDSITQEVASGSVRSAQEAIAKFRSRRASAF